MKAAIFTSLAISITLITIMLFLFGENSGEPKTQYSFSEANHKVVKEISQSLQTFLDINTVGLGEAMNHDDETIKYVTLWFSSFHKTSKTEARELALLALETSIHKFKESKIAEKYVPKDFSNKNIHLHVIFFRSPGKHYGNSDLSDISFVNGKIFYKWETEELFSKTLKEEIETLEEAIEKSGKSWNIPLDS